MRPRQTLPESRGDIAVDALVFEFMGLMMLALCVIVIALPSIPKPSGRRRN
jgi:hypothetical protein